MNVPRQLLCRSAPHSRRHPGLDPSGRSTDLLVERQSAKRLGITGELDLATAPQLADLLSDPTVDELDLSGVSFIDASGLTVLVAARDARGPEHLLLVTPSTAVSRILELTDELRAFTVWP